MQISPQGDGPPAPEHDAGLSRRMMLEFGVTAGKAAALAPRFTPEVIDAGIAWVRANAGENTYSRAGLLVTVLSDGTAAEAWGAAERQRAEAAANSAARELLERRCGALDAAFAAVLGHEDQATREEGRRRHEVIVGVWPALKTLAASEAVPDELLFADTIDATAVVQAAFEVAERLRERGGAPATVAGGPAR